MADELKPLKSGYYIWHYLPSSIAAGIFAVLFAISLFALSWRMWRTRTWFCSAFVIGVFMEFVGYCVRITARSKTDKLMPFILQNVFLLLPPTLFAASIYMILGRTIRLVNGERHSVVPLKWLTKAFVGGDVFSFCIQGGGAGLMAMGSNATTGQYIIIVGLVLQVVMFAVFAITAVIFHSRIRRNPTRESFEVDQNWPQILHMLYTVSGLIMVRSIFRVVEYIMGNDGYLLGNEWTMYVFDSVPMFAVCVIFFFRYPSNLQVSPKQKDISLESQSSRDGIIFQNSRH